MVSQKIIGSVSETGSTPLRMKRKNPRTSSTSLCGISGSTKSPDKISLRPYHSSTTNTTITTIRVKSDPIFAYEVHIMYFDTIKFSRYTL